jgi:hypothetical protein
LPTKPRVVAAGGVGVAGPMFVEPPARTEAVGGIPVLTAAPATAPGRVDGAEPCEMSGAGAGGTYTALDGATGTSWPFRTVEKVLKQIPSPSQEVAAALCDQPAARQHERYSHCNGQDTDTAPARGIRADDAAHEH